MTLPAIPFAQLYFIGVLAVWSCSSMACLLSVMVPPSSSLVAAVAGARALCGTPRLGRAGALGASYPGPG